MAYAITVLGAEGSDRNRLEHALGADAVEVRDGRPLVMAVDQEQILKRLQVLIEMGLVVERIELAD